MNRATTRPPRAGQQGFALLEALVGMIIFSIAVLGLVGLQASMTQAQSGSKYRADASYLASQFIGLMWADTANLAQYDADACEAHERCADWARKVAATLPGGAGSAAVNAATGVVTITITWTPPNEGTHRFSTATVIRS